MTTGPDDKPVLSTWTIYHDPADAPGLFVTRRWDIRAGVEPQPGPATQHHDMYAARQAVPAGLYRIDRQPGDDPTIVETWL